MSPTTGPPLDIAKFQSSRLYDVDAICMDRSSVCRVASRIDLGDRGSRGGKLDRLATYTSVISDREGLGECALGLIF